MRMRRTVSGGGVSGMPATYRDGMRVVAGTARGRRLAVPDGVDVRPTSDRVREATFNALHSLGAVTDAIVVDLFAGSGALGIEALSRGAERAVFVEPDRGARDVAAANLATLGFDDRSRVVATSAEAFLAAAASGVERFDLALCDPPYHYEAWPDLLASLVPVLAPDAVVVVESNRGIDPPSGWEVARDKAYGGTVVRILYPPDVPDRLGATT